MPSFPWLALSSANTNLSDHDTILNRSRSSAAILTKADPESADSASDRWKRFQSQAVISCLDVIFWLEVLLSAEADVNAREQTTGWLEKGQCSDSQSIETNGIFHVIYFFEFDLLN